MGTVFIILAISLISGEQGSSGEHTPNGTKITRGIGCALLAALCWSVSITILDHLLVALPPEAVGGFRFLFAFLLSAAAGSPKPFTFSKNTLLWIGVGSMAVLVLSNYFFLEAIRIVGSARAAPISSAYPVISVFLAAAFLREKVTRKILGGAFLSFLGVLFVVLS